MTSLDSFGVLLTFPVLDDQLLDLWDAAVHTPAFEVGHLNMAEVLPESYLRSWIENFANVVLRERDHLAELDSAIGDGEHGSNLARACLPS
jgi:dihydroxyacetone kinase